MIDALRNIPRFRMFSDASLDDLGSLVEREEVPAGERLFAEGDPGDAVYIVSSGEVEIRKQGKTLAVIPKGQLFGEMAAFEGRRTADAIVREAAVLHRIPHAGFREFLFRHPEESIEYLYEAAATLAGRLARTSTYVSTIYETGKVVAGDLPPAQMADRILEKLLEALPDVRGGCILVRDPVLDSFAIVSERGNPSLSEVTEAVDLLHGARETADPICETDTCSILRAPFGDGASELGAIFLEKPKDGSFGDQEEIITLAVADQVGLGLVRAFHRQEEKARERLARGRRR